MIRLHKTLIAGGLAAAGLLVSAGAAFAEAGYADDNVNLRAGPGTGYGVIETLLRGEAVDIEQCQFAWCEVATNDATGWASASYLSADTSALLPYPTIAPNFSSRYSLTHDDEENDHVHPVFHHGMHGGHHGTHHVASSGSSSSSSGHHAPAAPRKTG